MPPSLNPSRGHFKSFIAFLERHTKTDLNYLASGGFWLTLDEIGGGLAALLLAIAFAHYVPKDVYGTYRFLTAAYWTLTAFTMTGLSAAISRAVAKGREGVYRESFLYSIRWALPLSFISLGTSAYYFVQANTLLGYGFLIIAVLGPLMQSGYLWGTYFVGKKQFRLLSLYGLLFSLIPPLLLFLTMRETANPLFLLFAYLGGTAAVGLFLAFYILVKYRPNRKIDAEHRNLGAHFSAMNLLSTIAAQVDKLVVFHYLGAIDLAVYSFATAFPEQIKNVLSSITTLALPKFVTRPFKEIRENFWGRLWMYTAGLAAVAFAYMLVAQIAFDIFFPAYKEAVWYSQLYVLTLIPIGNAMPIALLQARGAKRELYILNVLSPVFQILTLVVLTAIYGLIGTIIARIAGRVWGFLIGGILLEVYALREKRGYVN